MKVTLESPSSIDLVTRYQSGIKPLYAKKGSTSQGDAWCSCGRCIGHLLYGKAREVVVGWFYTKCECGNTINWSEAKDRL